jgi:hypothetical protein
MIRADSMRALKISVTVMAVAGGCGSGGGSQTCGSAQTCGGDLVGDWKVTSSCLSATPEAFGVEGCPMAPTDLSKLVVGGTDTFKADKTEEMVETLSGTVTISFASSCIAWSGTPPDCSQVTARLTASIAKPDSLFSAATCKSGGGGCVCDMTVGTMSMTKSMTYATSGAVLTETESDGTVSQSTYCVSGTTLTQHTDGKMMGNQGLTGTVTLTKQ